MYLMVRSVHIFVTSSINLIFFFFHPRFFIHSHRSIGLLLLSHNRKKKPAVGIVGFGKAAALCFFREKGA